MTECLDKGLNPFTLTKNHSPTGLRMWNVQLDEYLSSGGCDAHEDSSNTILKAQCLHLFGSMDVKLAKMLQQWVTDTTLSLAQMDVLKHCKNLHDVVSYDFVNLMNLFQMKQNGDTSTSFLK